MAPRVAPGIPVVCNEHLARREKILFLLPRLVPVHQSEKQNKNERLNFTKEITGKLNFSTKRLLC